MIMRKGDFDKKQEISNELMVDLPQDQQHYHYYNQQSQAEYGYDQQQQHEDQQYQYDQQQQQSEATINEDQNKQVQNQNDIDMLKQQLIILYQGRVFNKILSKLQQRLYWHKFIAFSTIKCFIQSINQLNTQRQQNMNELINTKNMNKLINTKNMNKLINTIQSIVTRNTNTMRLKSYAFIKIKQIEHSRKYINQLKTSFFINYFINPTYNQLSNAFLSIKKYHKLSHVNNNNNLNSRMAQISTNKTTKINDDKLVKFQKQSRKFRVKQIFVTLRNFINKKYLKPTFNLINLYTHFKSNLYRQQKPNQNQNISNNQLSQSKDNNQLSQSKDARFIKKKIQPHKIIQDISTKRTYIDSNTLALQNIKIGNYQIQTIKRRQFQALHLFTNVIQKKIIGLYQSGFIGLYQSGFYTLVNKYSDEQKQEQNVYTQQNMMIKRVEQDSQVLIMRNVMKNMCYLSSKVSKKRQKKILTQRHQASIKIMSMYLNKSIRDLYNKGFYSIKYEIVRENMLILERIRQLQQVKRECLQYFNNSIMDDNEG